MINTTLPLGRAEDNEAVRYWTEQGGEDGPLSPPLITDSALNSLSPAELSKKTRSSRVLTKTLLKIHLTFQFYIFLPPPINIPYVCPSFCSSRYELFQRFAKTSRSLALWKFAFDFRTRLAFYFGSVRYWNDEITEAHFDKYKCSTLRGRTVPRPYSTSCLVLRCFLWVTLKATSPPVTAFQESKFFFHRSWYRMLHCMLSIEPGLD